MTSKNTGGPEKRPARSGRSDATYEKAIRENGGNITATAAALGITRGAFYVRLNKSQHLAEVLEEVRNEVVDMAEDGLRAQVVQQNMTAIIWTLKAHKEAKRRGWGERTEHTGPGGAPIVIRNDPMDEVSNYEAQRRLGALARGALAVIEGIGNRPVAGDAAGVADDDTTGAA